MRLEAAVKTESDTSFARRIPGKGRWPGMVITARGLKS